MRRYSTFLLAFLAVAAGAAAQTPDEPVYSAAPQPAADLARQEATARAHAMLCRRLGELQLTPDARVADFLAESADVRAFAWDAVRRQATVDRPQVYSDGVTSVQVHVPTDQVVARLAEVCQTHYRGDKFRAEDFRSVLLYTDREAIWGIGESCGEARPLVAEPAPVGWYDVGAFGRLQARRQATDNAHRQMLLRIRDLRFSPSRRVGDFMDSDPRVAADVTTFIRARQVVGDIRYLLQRICEVDASVTVADLVAELKSLATAYRTAPEFSPDMFDGLTTYAAEPVITVTGVAVPEAGDAPIEPIKEELWVRTAEGGPPDNVADTEQAELLATRAAVARCREQFRAALLDEPVPVLSAEEGEPATKKLSAWLADVPAVRGDVDVLLNNVRLAEVRKLKGGRVRVTVELALDRFRRLVAWQLAARHASQPPTGARE